MIDAVERAIRIAGVAGLITAWAVASWALIKAGNRPTGRGVGLARSAGAKLTYLVAAVPYFTIWVVLWRSLPGSPSPAWQLALAVVGALLGTAGLGLYVWGRLTLGRMYNVSSALGTELYADHRLVTSGPFRSVRHPMYVGIGLAALGGLAVYRTWTMVFAVVSVLGLAVKARHEDRLLAAEFGPAWQTYAHQVPAWWPRLRVRHHQPVPTR